MDEELLPLRDVVRALRTEITGSSAERPDQGVVFTVGPIELEFTVVAKREGGPTGTIKFGVLGIGAEFGASAKVASERTQKVKLTLNAEYIDRDGRRGTIDVNRVPKTAMGQEAPSRD